jgi:hypothetical protein
MMALVREFWAAKGMAAAMRAVAKRDFTGEFTVLL